MPKGFVISILASVCSPAASFAATASWLAGLCFVSVFAFFTGACFRAAAVTAVEVMSMIIRQIFLSIALFFHSGAASRGMSASTDDKVTHFQRCCQGEKIQNC